MNINEVTKIGQDLPKYWEAINFDTWWTYGGLIALAAFIAIGVVMIRSGGDEAGVGFMTVTVLASLFVIFVQAYLTQAERTNEHLADWKDNTLIPFIEELPNETHVELVQFIEKKPIHGIEPTKILSTKLTSVDFLEGAEYGELKYKVDGKIKTDKGWFVIEFVETGEASYTYKELTKTFNEDIKKGKYNKTIVMPVDKYKLEGTSVIYFNK